MSRGQYLERPVLIAVGAGCLEGLYHRGERAPAALILSPHPELGGSMDSPVVAELAWALTRAGHPTLRLNYRGVGASQGAWDGGGHDLIDLQAAVLHLRESVDFKQGASADVLLVGYSYGALLALRALTQEGENGVARVAILVAPPVARFELGPVVETLACRPGPGIRVFTLCGSEDPLAPPEQVAELFASFGARHQGVVIPGADHVFREGLTAVGHEAVRAIASTTSRP